MENGYRNLKLEIGFKFYFQNNYFISFVSCIISYSNLVHLVIKNKICQNQKTLKV